MHPPPPATGHADDTGRGQPGGTSSAFRALGAILQQTAFRSGQDYLDGMVRTIAQVLGVRYVAIGLLRAEEWQAATLALWAGDRLVPNMAYDLRGTPCEQVVDRQVCCYPSAVQASFPADTLLIDMGVESYLGAPTFDTAGRPLGLVAILDDKPIPADSVQTLVELMQILASAISSELERQRVLDRLEQSRRELVTANEAKTRFLANISHEIRTPLNGVVGGVALLECSPLDDEQRDLVATIGQCAHVLLSLIEDVLDLSRIEAGGLQLAPAPFCLDDLLQDVKAMFRVHADELGLAMRWQCLGGDLRLLGDRQRLRQVLINLVGNAMKFTSQGEVVVRASATARDGGVDCGIEVQDTGSGEPVAMRERIFEPFVQVDDSQTRRHGGAGLGLAISREIVEAMQGSITCAPAPSGTGSSFHVQFVLPAAAAAPLAPAAVAAHADELRARVLLVDDSPIGRRVATRMLEKLGCEVTTAADGREAIARFAPGAFDLVLMDCQMPVVDGLAATAAMRCDDQHTPIVALTAHAMASDAQRCREAGMNDYLTKPVTLAALRATVQRWTSPPDDDRR